MFFIKVHPWSLTLLLNALGYEHHQPTIDLSFLEQTSLYLELNSTENQHNVLYMPRPWFNAYEFHHAFEGERGDMFVHFPGLEDERWPHMQRWLDVLEGPEAVDWEVGFERTEYPVRIEGFWNAVEAAERVLAVARAGLGIQEGFEDPGASEGVGVVEAGQRGGQEWEEKEKGQNSELKAHVAALQAMLYGQTDQVDALVAATERVQRHLDAAAETLGQVANV
jgi:hypothetical protein